MSKWTPKTEAGYRTAVEFMDAQSKQTPIERAEVNLAVTIYEKVMEECESQIQASTAISRIASALAGAEEDQFIISASVLKALRDEVDTISESCGTYSGLNLERIRALIDAIEGK